MPGDWPPVLPGRNGGQFEAEPAQAAGELEGVRGIGPSFAALVPHVLADLVLHALHEVGLGQHERVVEAVVEIAVRLDEGGQLLDRGLFGQVGLHRPVEVVAFLRRRQEPLAHEAGAAGVGLGRQPVGDLLDVRGEDVLLVVGAERVEPGAAFMAGGLAQRVSQQRLVDGVGAAVDVEQGVGVPVGQSLLQPPGEVGQQVVVERESLHRRLGAEEALVQPAFHRFRRGLVRAAQHSVPSRHPLEAQIPAHWPVLRRCRSV